MVWEGVVRVFDLTGHRTATRALITPGLRRSLPSGSEVRESGVSRGFPLAKARFDTGRVGGGLDDKYT